MTLEAINANVHIPQWLENARAFERMMIHELPGVDAHPLIKFFFEFTQLAEAPAGSSDETPWCSAFACACMEIANIQSPRHALARSWLGWGIELDQPVIGCVCVLDHPNHVAFYNATVVQGAHAPLLGGNQSDKVCTRLYPTARVVSYRWPAHVPLP